MSKVVGLPNNSYKPKELFQQCGAFCVLFYSLYVTILATKLTFICKYGDICF
jgi:hypothetical protein